VRSNQGGRPDLLNQSSMRAAFARGEVPTDTVEHEQKAATNTSRGLFMSRFVVPSCA
jgi:hypothetical protein